MIKSRDTEALDTSDLDPLCMNMASTTEVKVNIEDEPRKTADEQVEGESEKSKGFCSPDNWWSPRGKSIPCMILLVFLYIIFAPFIILIICLSFICVKLYMTNPNRTVT